MKLVQQWYISSTLLFHQACLSVHASWVIHLKQFHANHPKLGYPLSNELCKQVILSNLAKWLREGPQKVEKLSSLKL